MTLLTLMPRLRGARWLTAFILAALSWCLSGCSQRELCYDHSHVSPVILEFDWSQAPDATPASMVVWFFSVSSDEAYRFEITGGDGVSRSRFDGLVNVRPGSYRVLCHNGSTDNNSEDGETFEAYRILTRSDAVLSPMMRSDDAPLPDSAGAQPVRSQASPLYAHVHDGVVTIEPAADHDTYVRFTPREVTAVYEVVITGVENMRSDTEASAVLTGMAEAWSPAGDTPAGCEVAVPFGLRQDGPDCLRGSLVTFGDRAPHDVRHTLRVYTSYKYYYDFDVTDRLHDAADPRHVVIELEGIKLPAGDGMTPGVSDWGDAGDVEVLM